MDRNTRLKDEMREKDVGRLVDSWSQILNQVSEQKISTDIGNLCIEVVGQYVEWIDINLVSYFNLLMGETVIDLIKYKFQKWYKRLPS